MEQAAKSGSGKVELKNGRVIVCTLTGNITYAVVRQTMTETKEYVSQLREQNRPPLLLIDVQAVTGQDSSSRTAAKELRTLGLKKVAVFGASRLLRMVAQYLIRASDMGSYARLFADRDEAMNWLQSDRLLQTNVSHRVPLLFLTITALICIATLVGWTMHQPLLYAVSQSYKAMNPSTAVLLLLLVAALSLLLLKPRTQLTTQVGRVVAALMIFFGIAALARYLLRIDLHVDTLLFSDAVNTAQTYAARVAPLTALSMILAGTALLLLTIKQPKPWHIRTFQVVHAIPIFVSVVVIAGYSFNLQTLTTLHSALPMPLITAIALFIVLQAYMLLDSRAAILEKQRKALTNYGASLMVCYSFLLLTGIAWQQTHTSIVTVHKNAVHQAFAETENKINSRITSYTNSLLGFKAFFESSSFVNPGEFQSYFNSSEVAKNYPGFRAITFVRSIPNDKQAAILPEIRAIPGYEAFDLRPTVSGTEHYGVMYVEPVSPTPSYGFDLASDRTRLNALHRARDSAGAAATNTINLNATRPDLPESNGFFLTVPVYAQQATEMTNHQKRAEDLYGFVNAVFQDDALLRDLLEQRESGTHYTVTSLNEDNKIIYQTGQFAKDQVEQQSDSIKVADRTWQLTLKTDPYFGVSRAERRLPILVLCGGGLLVVFSGFVVFSQARRRDQAVRLAADMTEDLNNERNAAVELQQKDEAILTSIGDAVFAIDLDRCITLFNPSAEKVSGYAQSEALGKVYTDLLKFILEKNGEPSVSFIEEALAGKNASMKNHTLLLRRDGVKVPVADSAAPIRDRSGQIMGVIVVFRDVSKEYELDRAKTEFVSVASHQLRTPLASVNWYAEMLLGGDAGQLNKEQAEYVTEMRDGNQRMTELVDSLLDVSRLDLGKLGGAPTPTPMPQLLESLHKELIGQISEKELHYSQDVEQGLSNVVADPKLLRMVLQNLMSNAVKYTPKQGSVTVSMKRATQAKVPSLYIAVTDTGYGIPESEKDKIFGKMFRANNVQRYDIEGNGLGLYIVKEVVEKLGGSITFESTEGKGTTFYVIVPFEQQTSVKNQESTA